MHAVARTLSVSSSICLPHYTDRDAGRKLVAILNRITDENEGAQPEPLAQVRDFTIAGNVVLYSFHLDPFEAIAYSTLPCKTDAVFVLSVGTSLVKNGINDVGRTYVFLRTGKVIAFFKSTDGLRKPTTLPFQTWRQGLIDILECTKQRLNAIVHQAQSRQTNIASTIPRIAP